MPQPSDCQRLSIGSGVRPTKAVEGARCIIRHIRSLQLQGIRSLRDSHGTGKIGCGAENAEPAEKPFLTTLWMARGAPSVLMVTGEFAMRVNGPGIGEAGEPAFVRRLRLVSFLRINMKGFNLE